MADENKSLAEANSTDAQQTPKTQEPVKSPEPVKREEQKPNNAEHVEVKKPLITPPLEKQSRYQTEPPKRQRKIRLYKIKNLFKRLHPGNVKVKLNHYWFEYSRVLHLARKPTRSEYKELAIMVAIGTSIIGAIGFVVQMIIQYV